MRFYLTEPILARFGRKETKGLQRPILSLSPVSEVRSPSQIPLKTSKKHRPFSGLGPVREEKLAERVGFEPTVQLPVLRFSRPTRSTAPAPLQRDGETHSPRTRAFYNSTSLPVQSLALTGRTHTSISALFPARRSAPGAAGFCLWQGPGSHAFERVSGHPHDLCSNPHRRKTISRHA